MKNREKLKLPVMKKLWPANRLKDLFGSYIYSKPHPVFLLKNQKTIFIPISKVASNSIKNAFEGFDKNHFIISRKRIKNYKSFFKVAFVRNPYDKIVSCYKDKILDRDENSRFIRHNKNMRPGMSFKEFVKVAYKTSDPKLDRHLKSQHYLLSDKKGNLIPDFIGKFESIKRDFEKICKKMGVQKPPELPQINKNNPEKDYRKYYDEETKKMVYERYKRDIEVFGYNF